MGTIVRSMGSSQALEAAQDYPLHTKEAHRDENAEWASRRRQLVRAGETIILDPDNYG
jgi:hypothetical protein